MTEAEEFNDMRVKQELANVEGRRRDGDFAYGQLVGATFVLDRIGAPTMLDGRTLTAAQRVGVYVRQRDELKNAQNANENGTSPQAGQHT